MLPLFDLPNWLALAWFFLCWFGYAAYANHHRDKGDTDSVSSALFTLRIDWAEKMLIRDETRAVDALLLGQLNRTTNFFASTALFLIAGALTMLAHAEEIHALLGSYTFVADTTVPQVKLKVLLLGVIFIYCFFKCTWSMRQYTFVAVLVGAAPYVVDKTALNEKEKKLAREIATLNDQAGHHFNYGLRAYYFALASLAWFISPYLFALACSQVVAVLYRREFRSRTLQILRDCGDVCDVKHFGKVERLTKV